MSPCDADNRVEYCADQKTHNKTSDVSYNKYNVKNCLGEKKRYLQTKVINNCANSGMSGRKLSDKTKNAHGMYPMAIPMMSSMIMKISY